jgi:hypothetical protein
MFCSQCGSDIPRGARYCAACGRSQDTKGRIVVPKNAILAVVVVGVALAALSAIIATQSDSPSSAQSEPTARVALVPPTHTVAAAPTPSASPPPQTPTSVPLQVANGTEMLSPENAGLGELTVENGSQRDAIVKLFNPALGRSVRAVYVVRDSTWTVAGIPAGVYIVRFASGRDWDAEGRFFQKDAGFTEFEETFDFTETETATGTNYTTWEVTLQAIAGGTAQTDEISAADFAN